MPVLVASHNFSDHYLTFPTHPKTEPNKLKKHNGKNIFLNVHIHTLQHLPPPHTPDSVQCFKILQRTVKKKRPKENSQAHRPHWIQAFFMVSLAGSPAGLSMRTHPARAAKACRKRICTPLCRRVLDAPGDEWGPLQNALSIAPCGECKKRNSQ